MGSMPTFRPSYKESVTMNRPGLFLLGAGLGLGAMYFLDPVTGRRRRALVRDQLLHGERQLKMGLDKALRDTRHRAQGFAAELRGTFSGDGVNDRVLAERVRSKMGRYVSHPSAIEVAAQNGRVELNGPILADEVEPLIAAIRKMHGVQSVANRLDVHQEAGSLSELHGGKRPYGERWNIAEDNWAPATRLGLVLTGGLLMAYGLTQRFPVSCIVGSIGLGACLAAARPGTTGENRQSRPNVMHRQGAARRGEDTRERDMGAAEAAIIQGRTMAF
jgi:hypothetical protein